MRNVLVLILIIIGLSGCSTRTIPLAPHFDYCNSTVTLAKSVNNGQASDAVNELSSDDTKLYALVSCSNLSGNHTLRWDWYSPSGTLYLSKSTDFSTSYRKFSENASAWHSLAIKGDRAEYLPGLWEVKVFIDRRLISSSSFTLVSANGQQKDTEQKQLKKKGQSNPFANDKPVPPTSGIKIK